MKVEMRALDSIKPYEKNAKKHDQTQIDNVAESIRQYGFVQPIVVDRDGVIVIGHCRALGAKKLGLKEVPCVCVDDLTEEQVNALRIVDNKTNESDWDFDLLEQELPEVDLSDFCFQFDFLHKCDDNFISDEIAHPKKTLVDKFVVPPFSVFDTRQGYWQDRKRAWKSKCDFTEFDARNGTSYFDPVVCELMYRWFNVKGGSILDPFSGGSVRGAVACILGYEYYGFDLRREQIDANMAVAAKNKIHPEYYCDDSANIDEYIEDCSVDFVFSCPPYVDFEVYSDDPRDLSNMNYDDFLHAYAEIIQKCCRKLKNNRFAAFVVGEVRDKKGFYRDFVDKTKKAFSDSGLHFYNDIVIVNAIGTGAARASRQFNAKRKVVNLHQKILVFYKGDEKQIHGVFGDVDLPNESEILSTTEME
nr:MAG TPA: Putative modification methylase [Caudoviricetes sp.]